MERNELDGFALLVLTLGGIAGAVGGLVWAGAALAAFVTGGSFHGSFGAALSAASRLPGRLSEPASVWPEPLRAALPGPWVYWLCTAVVLAAVVALSGLVLYVWSRHSEVGEVRRKPLGVDGRARFARRRELAPLVVKHATPGRLILGRARWRRLLATEQPARETPNVRRHPRAGDRGAVALVGPTRSGKTVAVVSGVLEWDGPAVLSSVKADLLGVTHGWRSRIGEVKVYDPTNTTGRASASWTPLRGAGTTTGAQQAARALCDAAPRGGVEGGMDFWLGQAERLLSGLLFVAHHAGRDMAAVCEWVMTQDRPTEHGPGEVKAALDALLASDDDARVTAAVAATQHLLSVWEMEDRTRSSVYATAQAVVWPWADPGVAAAARGPSVDLTWLLSGKNTLYLCAPAADRERLTPAFGGLLNDLIDQVIRRVDVDGHQPLDPPLLIVVDEAGNTPLRKLAQYASTLTSYGVLLVTVWQSVAQLEAGYGREADTILTNHLSKLFYSGLSDPAGFRYVASVLGDTDVPTRSRAIGLGSRGGQVSSVRVPLVPPHALRQMRRGRALLIHGTLPPTWVRTRPYFRERSLAGRAGLPPAGPAVARPGAPGAAGRG